MENVNVEKIEETQTEDNEYPVAPSVAQSEIFGNYFRLLSANYAHYFEGVLPWPAKPEGLPIVEPIIDYKMRRA